MSEKDIIENIMVGITCLPFAYLAAELTLRGISRAFSKNINTQEELDAIVIKEADKLGIQHPVSAKLASFFTVSHAYPAEYHIVIGGSATYATVRHELYHIYNPSKSDNPFYVFFVSEPRAIMYELFRTK